MKLRNRLYIALLPLQILLVGLAVWTIFLLTNLDAIFSQTQAHFKSLAKAYDDIILSVHELSLATGLAGRADSGIIRKEIKRSITAYSEAYGVISKDVSEANQHVLQEIEILNQRLIRRVNLLDEFPIGAIDPVAFGEIRGILRDIETRMARVALSNTQKITDLQATFRQRILTSFIVIGSGIFLGSIGIIVVAINMGRMILEPIELLHGQVEAVGKGDFESEIRLKRKDEIGQLATAFNQMIRRLRDYRTLTNQKLISTTRTFRTVLQRTPHAVLFLRPDYTIFYANPEADDLIGSPEFQHGLPETLKDYVEMVFVKRNIHVQKQLAEAIRIETHGQTRYILASAFPVDLVSTEPEEEGFENIQGVALLLQDVTRMKLADNLKSNVVATVSHELKTPLTSARMSLYLLEEQQVGPLNEEQLKLVNTAKGDLERQLTTIQNLLDLSRIEHRRSHSNRAPCRANEIVVRSLGAQNEIAKAMNVRLDYVPSPEDPFVMADERQLEIVLNNFISNAVKHSGENSVVTVRVSLNDDKVTTSVTDQGPGIPEDLKPRIFERFARGNNHTHGGSTGLGLSIARDIIQSHNGEIGFESVNGRGSTFYYTLSRH